MEFIKFSIVLIADNDNEKMDDKIEILPNWSPYNKNVVNKTFTIKHSSPNNDHNTNNNKTIMDEYTVYEYLENLFNIIVYDRTYKEYQINFPFMTPILINRKDAEAFHYILSQTKVLLSDPNIWTVHYVKSKSKSNLNPNAKEYVPRPNKHIFFDEDGNEYTNFTITRHL
jgi:hypothetical protein